MRQDLATPVFSQSATVNFAGTWAVVWASGMSVTEVNLGPVARAELELRLGWAVGGSGRPEDMGNQCPYSGKAGIGCFG